MKKELSFKQNLLLASLLFGMLFGAGNLIFPVFMGQLSGKMSFVSAIGFSITGVGLPLLGVLAIGLSQSEGLFDGSLKIGKWFAYAYTTMLYLSIGALFGIPRTAAVSFTTGVTPFIKGTNEKVALFIYSLIFFALVLIFSLKPSKIIDFIGKYLNPIFLVFLFLLVALTIVNPIGNVTQLGAQEAYKAKPFFVGLLEGYNTMDGLASVAFAIVIIEAIRKMGVTAPKDIARETVKSGSIASIFMVLIYISLTFAGAQIRFLGKATENGGLILSDLAKHYYGGVGNLVLAGIMIFACLKTAIGLVTSCSETFSKMYPNLLSYRGYAVAFTLGSFLVSNFGLDAIISLSLPMLFFSYPITIVFIALLIFEKLFGKEKAVFESTMILTIVGAFFNVFSKYNFLKVEVVTNFLNMYKKLPLFDISMEWVFFSLVGLVIGLLRLLSKKKD